MSGTIDHANVSLKFDILQLSALDLGVADFPVRQDWSFVLANGTGVGQASQLWSDTRSLAGSASDALDLAGSLVNAFGVTVTFTKIKLLAVRAAATNNLANALNVTRAASNGVPLYLAASDGEPLLAGGIKLWYDPNGVTVTAATGDILTLTNAAATNTIAYDILIVGTD